MEKLKWTGVTMVVLLGVIIGIGQNCSQLKPTVPLSTDSSTPASPALTPTLPAGGGGSGGGVIPITIPTSVSDACVPNVTPPAGVTGKSPSQLRQYANLDHIAACGDNVTVAVIISAGTSDIRADLATYSSAWGLPAPTATNFRILMPDGSCGAVSPLESHIDVEMVHALAPNANIIMACGSDATSAGRGRAIQAAIAAGATIISMSWGAPETSTDINNLEPIFQANPGVTFFAGSGDSGSNDLGGVPRVAYPASSPEVIAVGASADTGGENLAAWPNSGGGISAFFSLPTWQNGLASAFPYNKRLVPDIAFNGANTTPTAIYGAAGWTGASGTSVSSPIAAGMMAIANQIYGRSLGDIHAKLYATYPSQLTYFRDVVSGTNGDYNAGTGYDLLSGLGTPRAQSLFPALQ